ncbi:hypothetical protein BDV98DRAFT_647559 [Pterulicium gracile]|uniref:C3H1-type domain-containing protein n=1 Tax=Pterulicium gracile TaxID=1884261 RepID=A0A5C3QX39_9AGAR|nr:hypothetical protein BDV98DRAFT_647559 [Pterula gracilis]
MTSRADTNADMAYLAANRQSVRSNHISNPRWRMNGPESAVDSNPRWDLSDEINKLKIGSGAVEEELRASIRTPPKPRAVTALTHFSDGSPPDTSSLTSTSPSPHIHDRPVHSRGSSTDSSPDSSRSHDSNVSTTGHAMANGGLKPARANESKERPHSFSGGLSTSDLRRLQIAGDAPPETNNASSPVQLRQPRVPSQFGEQPSYPSLSSHGRSQVQTSAGRGAPNPAQSDDLQVDYSVQQRNFNPVSSHAAGGPTQNGGAYQGRMNNNQFRSARGGGFSQQNVGPSPTALNYHGNAQLQGSGAQQLYDLMHPHEVRAQQQHNVYGGGLPNASDPAMMREAAAMALLGNSVQGFNPGMFQGHGMPMYSNQFYGGQDVYNRPNVITAQALAAAQQYAGPYGVMSNRNADIETSSSPSSAGQGPSANNRKLGLYKTELCRNFEEKGTCRYGTKCQFAHGEDELRNVSRHPKYKTEICRTFWVSGSCPYGKRCCFIHTELPPSGPNQPADSSSSSHGEGHNRTPSTTSDPNDTSISLLTRIKTQASNPMTATTPTSDNITPMSAFPSTRPAALRVVTALDNAAASKQQNKSAYPSFAGNGVLLPASENQGLKSPAPVTAGPDLGGRNNFAYGAPSRHKTNSSSSSVRNSYSGDDLELIRSAHQAGVTGFALTPSDTSVQTPRANGHARTGSAGNWGNIAQNSNFTAASAYPRVGAGVMPWSTDIAVGSNRVNEQAWP